MKAFSASSEEVVACSSGLSNFSIDVSDSPSLCRMLAVALPKALRTSSLLGACACSWPREAPVDGLMASGRILRINEDSIRTWDDVVQMILTGPAELRFRIAGRAQPRIDYTLDRRAAHGNAWSS